VEITTVIPSISGACASVASKPDNSFPGIYTDQLPRNCFLSNDCVVMSSPWGSVESLIAVHLPTKSIQKIDVALEGTAQENINKISSNILDIQRVENANTETGESRSQVLLTVGTPCSSQVVGVLDVLLKDEKNGDKLVISSSLVLQPDDYSVAQMPISRKKPTVRKEAAPTPSSEAIMTAEAMVGSGDKLYGPNAKDLRDRLADKKDLNSLLTWQTNRYHDEKGIPYESILITPKRTDKGVFGFESMGVDRKCPLIVVPHGGPHSCMTTSYVASYAFLALRLGAAVLHVNYRGSTGFGQDSIDALPGTHRLCTLHLTDILFDPWLLFLAAV
jgi:dipeptidyl aminopeptidase/acylaminoacyl peptidase